MAFAIAAAVGTLGFSAIALPPNGAGPVGLSTNTVFNGGTSVGVKDVVAPVIDRLGAPGVLVHGVNIRPGKPTLRERFVVRVAG